MQQSSATPSLHHGFWGLQKIVACSQTSSQCLLVSIVFGTVSSLHPISFLMIFTLVAIYMYSLSLHSLSLLDPAPMSLMALTLSPFPCPHLLQSLCLSLPSPPDNLGKCQIWNVKEKEAECKGKKRALAEKMKTKEKEQESKHNDVNKVKEEMLKAVDGIPQKCKDMGL